MANIYPRLRALAAGLAALTGLAQAATPWIAVPSADVLLVAFCGSAYLLLALGLFGSGRLSLLLAMLLPALRAWQGLWPLPDADVEFARLIVDLMIPALCLPVLLNDLRAGRPGTDRGATV